MMEAPLPAQPMGLLPVIARACPVQAERREQQLENKQRQLVLEAEGLRNKLRAALQVPPAFLSFSL